MFAHYVTFTMGEKWGVLLNSLTHTEPMALAVQARFQSALNHGRILNRERWVDLYRLITLMCMKLLLTSPRPSTECGEPRSTICLKRQRIQRDQFNIRLVNGRLVIYPTHVTVRKLHYCPRGVYCSIIHVCHTNIDLSYDMRSQSVSCVMEPYVACLIFNLHCVTLCIQYETCTSENCHIFHEYTAAICRYEK